MVPARLSWTVSPTTSATGSLDLISLTTLDELMAVLLDPRIACQDSCQGLTRNFTAMSSPRVRNRPMRASSGARMLPPHPFALFRTYPHHGVEISSPTRHEPALPPTEAATASALSEDAWERAAFHELHGRTLHGFALLMMLGETAAASRCAGESIAFGMSRLDELRHPERAAAWLRRDVLRRLPRRDDRPAADRLPDLDVLGVDASVLAGLAALTRTQRAALVAADVERLGSRDVATVAGRSGARLDRLLTAARRRYLEAYRTESPPRAIGGSIADHVATTARRALG